MGPRICKNVLVAAEDGPLYTQLARALELHSASPETLSQCSTYRHVYRVYFKTPEAMMVFVNEMTDFILVDELSETDCLVMARHDNTKDQVVIPGRSMFTSSVHDGHAGDFFHLYDPKLYTDIGRFSNIIFAAGALEVLLVTRFEPSLSGILIPSPSMINERLETWVDRDVHEKIKLR